MTVALSPAKLDALIGVFLHGSVWNRADGSYASRAGGARARCVEDLRDGGFLYPHNGRNRPPAAGRQNELTVKGLRALKDHFRSGKAPQPRRSIFRNEPLDVQPLIAQIDERLPAMIEAEAVADKAMADYEAAERARIASFHDNERARKIAGLRALFEGLAGGDIPPGDPAIVRVARIMGQVEDEDALLAFASRIVDVEMGT